MSAERINIIEEKNNMTLNSPSEKKKIFPGRVDINHLLARVRKQEKKDNLTNSIFFALFVALLVISGLLLSL